MPNVEFNEPSYATPYARQKQGSFISNLVVKTGLAKDEAGAQKVLLVIFILVIIAAVLVWWFGARG